MQAVHRMMPETRLIGGALAGFALVMAGCGGSPTALANAAAPGASPASRATAVGKESVPSGDMGGAREQMYSAGQTGTLYGAPVGTQGAAVPLVRITVSAPTFSTTDYGREVPMYEYFATFTVRVTNVEPRSLHLKIAPSDSEFFAQTSDGLRYGVGSQPNVLVGNSIGATAPDELGTNSAGYAIELRSGQSTTGAVVIDVPSRHGQLVFSPGNQNYRDYGAWSY